jgi:hypothetical protein
MLMFAESVRKWSPNPIHCFLSQLASMKDKMRKLMLEQVVPETRQELMVFPTNVVVTQDIRLLAENETKQVGDGYMVVSSAWQSYT